MKSARQVLFNFVIYLVIAESCDKFGRSGHKDICTYSYTHKPLSRYPDLMSCTRFFSCETENPTAENCSNNTYFDPVRGVCGSDSSVCQDFSVKTGKCKNAENYLIRFSKISEWFVDCGSKNQDTPMLGVCNPQENGNLCKFDVLARDKLYKFGKCSLKLRLQKSPPKSQPHPETPPVPSS